MYVYQETEPGVWTVGFFTPTSTWTAESDFQTQEEAIAHMRYLNGAPMEKKPARKSPTPPPTPAVKPK